MSMTHDVFLLSSLQKDLVTSLIPQLKGEKRDGSSASDPYVAFRRRTEKMQTRKVQFLHAWAFQLSKFNHNQDKRQYVSRLMPGISDSFVVISNWCLPWVWTTVTLFSSFQNRKNDEASYEKMLKLRRDLNRACTILDMVKRREQSKKEHLQLTVEVFEKRQVQQWNCHSFVTHFLGDDCNLKGKRHGFFTSC